MIYTRYVIAPSDGSLLHGHYSRVQHLWDHGDGLSMFCVECDDPGFAQLVSANDSAALMLMPSLNAPAHAIGGKITGYLAAQGITAAPGDTVLNLLRKFRDSKGVKVFIDQPY